MNLARTFVFVRHRVHVQPLADRTDHLDAMLVAAMAGSAFFAPAVTASRVATTVRPAVRMSSGEDPTANPLTQAINSLQEAMQNSPVANLKQSLAKMQAGDYDVDAVSARLNGLITDTPVVMFSFST